MFSSIRVVSLAHNPFAMGGIDNMKRKCKMVLCLVLVLLTVSACSSQQNEIASIPNITQAIGPTVAATAAPTQAPQSDSLTDGAPMNDGSSAMTVPWSMTAIRSASQAMRPRRFSAPRISASEGRPLRKVS